MFTRWDSGEYYMWELEKHNIQQINTTLRITYREQSQARIM